MKSSASLKLIGDGYEGFYTAGLTMISNDSIKRFKSVRSDESETVLKTDDGLTLFVTHVRDKESDATNVVTSFKNDGKEAVTLEMMTSFLLTGIKADKVHRIRSFWSEEGRLKTDALADLNLERAWNNMAYRVEKFGTVGTMPVRSYFPFVALEDSESGTFTGVLLCSPASWQIEIIIREDDTYTLAGGIADRDFGHWSKEIKPGEEFIAPRAIAATGNSLLDVCDKLVKAQHPDISPVDDHMGIVFNEYCTTWGHPSYDNLKKMADKLEGKGIQYLVMDSGWYGATDSNWWESTGDWEVNEEIFPGGLKPICDYIRNKGMIPGIWFEYETVGYKSRLFNDAEHLLNKDGHVLTVGNRRFLDLENPWVKDFLDKYVIGLLKDSGYGYIKVDYNDTLGIGVDGPESLGENLRRKVEANRDFFKKMKKEIPDLVIENCSSGGHRLEPSMMELASMASFSDAHEILSLPIIAANLHRVIRPEQNQIWAVLRATDDDARLYYSLCATFLGRMGLSGDIYDMSDRQWELLNKAIAFYKEVSDIIKCGKTTVLFTDATKYNDPTGSQLVIREYNGQKLLVYHRFKDSLSLEEFALKYGIKLFEPVSLYGIADKDFSACVWVS